LGGKRYDYRHVRGGGSLTYLYSNGHLQQAQALALGSFLSFIGLKVLTLALVPMVKAIPAHFPQWLVSTVRHFW
jgi:hypothetical protein